MTEGTVATRHRADGWHATDLAHLPVVNVPAGQVLGEVADVVFDPATSRVIGLLVRGNWLTNAQAVLHASTAISSCFEVHLDEPRKILQTR